MSNNNFCVSKVTDEMIALRLGISVEQYRKERDDALQHMKTIVQQVEDEKVRIISQIYRDEIERDPQIIAELLFCTDVSVSPSTHIDENGVEHQAYTWTFTPQSTPRI